MKRIIAVVAFAAAILLGYTATPAFAAYNCPSGYMCMYTGANGTGTVYPISASWTGCRALPSAFDDTTSSIDNSTGYKWLVFPAYTTTCNTAGASYGTIYANSTGNMTGIFNDTITMYKRI